MADLESESQENQGGANLIRDASSDGTSVGLDLSSNPTIRLLSAPDRLELQDSYFKAFHPHWPLLHKETFLNSSQPPELVAAVLTAGLWVSNTPETRSEARFNHDALLTKLNEQVVRKPACNAYTIYLITDFLPSSSNFTRVLIDHRGHN